MTQITTNNLKLRPFSPDDAEEFCLGINTQTIGRDTTIPLPWDIDSIKWWIGFVNDCAKRFPVTELHFVIEKDGNLIGSIGIINIDVHKAEIGYWLKDEYAGKGIMTKAVGLAVDHALQKMNLKRIFAPILPHNKASARVLEKNGFEKEGVLRKFYLKDGKYVDAICYAKIG